MDMGRAYIRAVKDNLPGVSIVFDHFHVIKLNTVNGECDQLKNALKLNEPLAIAYYLKDDLGQIWKQNDKPEADFLLWEWIKKSGHFRC